VGGGEGRGTEVEAFMLKQCGFGEPKPDGFLSKAHLQEIERLAEEKVWTVKSTKCTQDISVKGTVNGLVDKTFKFLFCPKAYLKFG
jgi:hypothetical protein